MKDIMNTKKVYPISDIENSKDPKLSNPERKIIFNLCGFIFSLFFILAMTGYICLSYYCFKSYQGKSFDGFSKEFNTLIVRVAIIHPALISQVKENLNAAKCIYILQSFFALTLMYFYIRAILEPKFGAGRVQIKVLLKTFEAFINVFLGF